MKNLIHENANPAGLFRVGPNFFPLGGLRSRPGIKLDSTYEIGQKLRSRWPRQYNGDQNDTQSRMMDMMRGLFDELIPRSQQWSTMCIGFKDAVGEPVVCMNCQMFSAGLSSGHLGGSGKMVMLREGRACPYMPAGLIEQQHGVRAGRDVFGDLGEMQVIA